MRHANQQPGLEWQRLNPGHYVAIQEDRFYTIARGYDLTKEHARPSEWWFLDPLEQTHSIHTRLCDARADAQTLAANLSSIPTTTGERVVTANLIAKHGLVPIPGQTSLLTGDDL